MGVYRIRNRESGRSFLGSTKDLASMRNRFDFGALPNLKLQADWDALGPEAFEFQVIDELKPTEDVDADPREDLRMLEELWREKLKAAGEQLY
jgi:hypothetical protein